LVVIDILISKNILGTSDFFEKNYSITESGIAILSRVFKLKVQKDEMI